MVDQKSTFKRRKGLWAKEESEREEGWYDFCIKAFFKERKKNIKLLQCGKYKKTLMLLRFICLLDWKGDQIQVKNGSLSNTGHAQLGE